MTTTMAVRPSPDADARLLYRCLRRYHLAAIHDPSSPLGRWYLALRHLRGPRRKWAERLRRSLRADATKPLPRPAPPAESGTAMAVSPRIRGSDLAYRADMLCRHSASLRATSASLCRTANLLRFQAKWLRERGHPPDA
jgi:hypothetical protein